MHTARDSTGARRIGPLVLLVGFHLSLVLLPARAQAPPEDDPFAGVEEMIVLGKETIGTLTDAAVSVTSFDASDLVALGVVDISDISQFTPNLEIRTAGSTAATFFIRGVGLNDFTANASGSVAVYVDDAPKNLPAIQLGQLFDLEGIEILKGPQGSGPGRNASAGAIRIFTKQPTGELGGFFRVNYGNYDYVDAEGALEVSIVEDVLAARMAFRLTQRDGIVKNRCAGFTQAQIDLANGNVCGALSTAPDQPASVTPGLDKNVNDQDKWAARMTLRYLPPIDDMMEWTFTFHGGRLDQTGTVGQHIGTLGSYGSSDRINYQQPEIGQEGAQILASLSIPTRAECRRQHPPGPARNACFAEKTRLETLGRTILSERLGERPLDLLPFEGDYNNPGFERQTTWGALLRGDWEFKGVTLVSITGFERYDRERFIDADYSPNVFFEFAIDDDAWQFTEDLRLSGELEAYPVSWHTGIFFLQEELDYVQDTLARNPLVPFRQSYLQETSSLGVFGEFAWEFLDDFTLEAGARYNWERKVFDADIRRGAGLADQCLPNSMGVVPKCKRKVTVDHPTGTVVLKYAFDELRNFYIKYSHGWKGSQFNVRDGAIGTQVTDVASPEIIDAYELGFNGSWLDGRLRMDGALFSYQYENYQVFTFINDAGTVPQRVVVNASDAQIYGAELEGRLEPVDTLVFDIRFGWLESKFLNFTDSVLRPLEGRPGQFFRQPLNFSGNPLPNAPRFQVSGSVQYDLWLGKLGTLIPRYDFSWSDDVAFDQTDGRGTPNASGVTFLPKNAIGQDALLLQNFRLTYQDPSGNFEVVGWVRNLTNEVYKTLSFDATGGPAFVGNLLGDPRTYGLSVQFEY